MDVDDDDSDDDGARALASARPTLCYPGRLTSRRESRAFADAGARGAHKVGGAPVALTADDDDDDDAATTTATRRRGGTRRGARRARAR